jgi:2-polyprenyl-6-methoxyphenol hydroxylase-like FAD-dependent oxidoreductase
MQITETDVLICGAGPSGLMIACQLTLHGIDCRIIDQHGGRKNFSGALIVHAASLHLFKQLGIHNEIIRSGVFISTLHMMFERRKDIIIPISQMGQDVGCFFSPLMIHQAETERIMKRYLYNHGKKVEYPVALTDFHSRPEGVHCILTGANGQVEHIHAQYLIGADGANSFVRRKLQINMPCLSQKRNFFIMDCLADFRLPPDEVLFSFSREASIGIFPTGPGQFRIDGAIAGVKENEADWIVSNLGRKIKLPFEIRQCIWFSNFNVHSGLADSFASGNCFLIGDAAHVFTPVGSQGMNQGFYDAGNLSEKLFHVICRKQDVTLLQRYTTERRAVAKRTSKISMRLFVFLSSDRKWRKWFRFLFLGQLMEVLLTILKIRFVRAFIFRGISGF